MKPLLNAIVLALLIFAFHAARAADQQQDQFTFAGAQTAFSAAAVPEDVALTGDWFLVGEVSLADPQISGYWSNGRYPSAGWSGLFQFKASITTATDALGQPNADATMEVIGAETGHVYRTEKLVGAPTVLGWRLDLISDDQSQIAGALAYDCRLITEKNLLICAEVVATDTAAKPQGFQLFARPSDLQ